MCHFVQSRIKLYIKSKKAIIRNWVIRCEVWVPDLVGCVGYTQKKVLVWNYFPVTAVWKNKMAENHAQNVRKS